MPCWDFFHHWCICMCDLSRKSHAHHFVTLLILIVCLHTGLSLISDGVYHIRICPRLFMSGTKHNLFPHWEHSLQLKDKYVCLKLTEICSNPIVGGSLVNLAVYLTKEVNGCFGYSFSIYSSCRRSSVQLRLTGA